MHGRPGAGGEDVAILGQGRPVAHVQAAFQARHRGVAALGPGRDRGVGVGDVAQHVVVGVDLLLGREVAVELHRRASLAVARPRLPAIAADARAVGAEAGIVRLGAADGRYACSIVLTSWSADGAAPKTPRIGGSAAPAEHRWFRACARLRLCERGRRWLLRRLRGLAGAAAAPPAADERRQVAVLFVDLVGFTRLTAELGAEETQCPPRHVLRRRGRDRRACGGSVDKHIGDCVMALFGAPTARGDDVARAVRAALAVVAAMPDMSARVGRRAAGSWRDRRRRRGGGRRWRRAWPTP